MNRIDRLTAIIIFLEGRHRVSVEELTERYNISERTVFRDLKALQEAGVPIGSEPGEGYYIVKGYHLPPVMFNKSEATSLLAGERLMQRWNHTELGKSYLSALDKIRSTLPHDDKEYFESLDEHIQAFPYRHQPNAPEDDRIFERVQNAIYQKEIIEINYSRPYSEEQTIRRVEPLGLLTMGNHWYLAAWCKLREGYRLFRLDRFRKFTKTGVKLRQPPEHTLQDFYDDNLLKERNLIKVVLWFDVKIARYVGDQKYWHGWAWEKPTKGGIEMTFMSPSLEYMARWLLTWTNSIRVIEPIELKELLLELGKEIVAHFSQKSPAKTISKKV